MQNKNKNILIYSLLTLLVASIVLLAFFILSLKSQGANDIKTFVTNQKITIGLNNKYQEIFKNSESELRNELNASNNPLD